MQPTAPAKSSAPRLMPHVRPLDDTRMKALILLSVVPVLLLTACSRVGAGRTCDWQPGDNASPLDFRDRSQGLHLMGEALRAEDLAVRYADVHRGQRSGQYAGNEAYQHAREQCMATLFD